MKIEEVILVDEEDRPIGKEEKLSAHKAGKLHRCFSIFVFNSKGELLLQKRAKSKYHSGGLWTNTCCGHPRPGEKTFFAAKRRLKEEMGFICPIKEISSFSYRAELDHGIIENEFDHVFAGIFDGEVKADSKEAEDYKWIDFDGLVKDVKKNPDKYTYWFKICFEKTVPKAKKMLKLNI